MHKYIENEYKNYVTNFNLYDELESEYFMDASAYRWDHILEQFTGLYDKNGNEIYEGDLLNVLYESGDERFTHDGVYSVSFDTLGAVKLVFESLLWESWGYNQYPYANILCQEYGQISSVSVDGQRRLRINETWNEDHMTGKRWIAHHESLYIEKIGNIHEQKHLISPPT